MGLIAKVIGISRAKLHCSRLTTVQDIQDYASLVFFRTHWVIYFWISLSLSGIATCTHRPRGVNVY